MYNAVKKEETAMAMENTKVGEKAEVVVNHIPVEKKAEVKEKVESGEITDMKEISSEVEKKIETEDQTPK
eukprot:15152474-Ditylum_brightwellii.AAC.1